MDQYPDPSEFYEEEYIDPDEYELALEQDEPTNFYNSTHTTTLTSTSQINIQSNTQNTLKSLFSQAQLDEIYSKQTSPNKSVEEPIEIQENQENCSLPKQVSSPPKCNDPITEKVSKKRPLIEDVFGDIDDILIDEQHSDKKRKNQKTDHERDLELIEKIIQLRQAFNERTHLNLKTNHKTNQNPIPNTCLNINRRKDMANTSTSVPRWPFITVKKSNGERIYVRFHSESYCEDEIYATVQGKYDFKHLIGLSFNNIWREATALVDKMSGDLSKERTFINNDENPLPETIENELWVDRYKPRKYIELLSDESTNRSLLRWIKLWDRIVFNRETKSSLKSQNQDVQKGKFEKPEFARGSDGRPFHKVALLCGPPGLGKTTLAHLVASHAGYNVVEINASDDRSIAAFENALDNATLMKSVIDKENKPNCLILDEIDGAPATSIDFLLKYIDGTHKKRQKSKKDPNVKPTVLKRPVICICNDLYTPALRNLRSVAFVLHFPPTASVRLGERLMEISKYQHVRTDMGALMALCEKTQNDIRACLSVLHFFKSQNKPVKLIDIHKSNVGQKDIQRSLFSVWEDIFFISRRPNTGYQLASKPLEGKDEFSAWKSEDSTSFKTRMAHVLHVVHKFGDYDKLIQGVFENYPKLKFRDSSMQGVCEALEWFVLTDIWNVSIYEAQNFVLLPYMPYAFVMWHFVFAGLMRQQLSYPSQGFEMFKKSQNTRSILCDVHNQIPPSIRTFVQVNHLLLDILPFLIEILHPTISTHNIKLLNDNEKANLAHTINVMLDYNIDYVQERQIDGTYKYNLVPNVEEVIFFNDTNDQSSRPNMSYATKQLIARELQIEKLRRNDSSNVGREVLKPTRKEEDLSVETPLTPSRADLVKLAPRKIEEPPKKKMRNFFGQIVENSEETLDNPRQGRISSKSDIWYHFKEGYNNAVRKNIKIDFFM